MSDRDSPTDETLSVRVPLGTKNKLRAASGQSPSRIVRYMVMGYLERATLARDTNRLSRQAAEGILAGAQAAAEQKESNHGQ